MQTIYGSRARDLHFVVMVREPLSRMHSWWYYCGKSKGFEAHAADELRRGSGSAWHSTYGWQLQEWAKGFRLRQFYVIPYHLFSGSTSRAICDDISARLQFKMECANVAMDVLHGSHPSLEQDTSEGFRMLFDSAMAADKGLLLKTLAKGSTKGMGLPSYNGAPQDEKALHAWLVNHW